MNRTKTRRQAEPWMAILKGVLAAVRRGSPGGVTRGALVGFLYIAAGVLVIRPAHRAAAHGLFLPGRSAAGPGRGRPHRHGAQQGGVRMMI